jgi:hypothetical protein
MEFFTAALKALPAVAGQPLALIGYVAVVASWTFVAFRVKRNQALLSRLRDFPPSDRLAALKAELGHVEVREGLSAEQYVRARAHTWLLIAYVTTCVTIILIIVLAVRHAGQLEVDVTPSVRAQPSAVITLDLTPTAYAAEHMGPDPDFAFTLTSSFHDGVYYVGYELPYLDAIAHGREVRGKFLFGGGGVLPWEFPELSVKIANNSSENVLFSRAQVEVSSSTVDERSIPVFAINPFNVNHILIHNEGWGAIRDASIRYRFVPASVYDSHGTPTLDLAHAAMQKLGTIVRDVNVDVGRDVPRNLRSERAATAVGIFEYTTNPAGRKVSVPFKTVVPLIQPPPLGPPGGQETYDVLLEAGRSGYTRTIPLTESAKAGETRVFKLRVATEKSARFDIRVSLTTTSGKTTAPHRFVIDIFKPSFSGGPLLRNIRYMRELDRRSYQSVAHSDLVDGVYFDPDSAQLYVCIGERWVTLDHRTRDDTANAIIAAVKDDIKGFETISVMLTANGLLYSGMGTVRIR